MKVDVKRDEVLQRECKHRCLLLFGVIRLSEILAKGNVDYVRHYERAFDRVYVAFLYGYWPEDVVHGKTTLVSLGSRHHPWVDLLLSPWRLLRLARALKPTVFLTPDLVFSWWTTSLVRLFTGAKVVLVPVCMPHEIYASTGRSLSGIPIWLERMLSRLAYASATKIIMSRNAEALVQWLQSDRQTARKLQVVDCLVEEFPSHRFLEQVPAQPNFNRTLQDPPTLLYVGRLHPEKMTLGLVDMIVELRRIGGTARLVLAGAGPELEPMRARAETFGVAGDIEFLGFVPADELPDVYARADIFVSTVTGTALREAGLCGLPVVGYEVDWVRDLLVHETTALLVPVGDTVALAAAVARALRERDVCRHMAENFHAVARSRWNPERISKGLVDAFGEAAR
jgi:glycosyltransferase involved in cell wall biosynthesis